MSAISVPFKKHDTQSIGSPSVMYRKKDAYISKFGKAGFEKIKTGVGSKRNDPCYCGSGKKYKKCCINKD